MKTRAAFIALVILSLGVITAWQLTANAQVATTGVAGGVGVPIGTIVPAAPTAILSATATVGNSFPANPQDRVTPAAPEVPPRALPGIPAIVPTTPDALLGLPTFDAATAATFALAHPIYKFNYEPRGEVTVASVEFLQGAQLGERGVLPGYQPMPEQLFCAVFLVGIFNAPAPDKRNSGPLGQSSSTTRIYVLFDARTGNYIAMGGLNSVR